MHKNVRPETVLGFKSDAGRVSFFLLGFEKIRMADGRTQRSGDSTWEKNLYRHPQRQGLLPDKIYTMQHDIYSLGVCLLEIGLWESFLFYENDTPTPSQALGLDLEGSDLAQPMRLKDHLVALAEQDLPDRTGPLYKDIVVNCLTCLDPTNADFGDQSEFQDADGVVVGARYIEKVR